MFDTACARHCACSTPPLAPLVKDKEEHTEDPSGPRTYEKEQGRRTEDPSEDPSDPHAARRQSWVGLRPSSAVLFAAYGQSWVGLRPSSAVWYAAYGQGCPWPGVQRLQLLLFKLRRARGICVGIGRIHPQRGLEEFTRIQPLPGWLPEEAYSPS